jgi:phosphoglycolate phosphatase-like HAD superfamily hydrolase
MTYLPTFAPSSATVLTRAWRDEQERERVISAGRGATVIWDFDGVIFDSQPTIAESFRTVLERRGYSPDPWFFRHLMGRPETRIWEDLRHDGAPVPDVEQAIVERRSLYLEEALEVLEPSWLAVELMPVFAAAGSRQVIVSNGDFDINAALLARWGLDEHVEQLRRAPGTTKASLLPGLLRGKALALEDDHHYLGIARSAGAFCVGVVHSMSKAEAIRSNVTVQI